MLFPISRQGSISPAVRDLRNALVCGPADALDPGRHLLLREHPRAKRPFPPTRRLPFETKQNRGAQGRAAPRVPQCCAPWQPASAATPAHRGRTLLGGLEGPVATIPGCSRPHGPLTGSCRLCLPWCVTRTGVPRTAVSPAREGAMGMRGGRKGVGKEKTTRDRQGGRKRGICVEMNKGMR